MKRPPANRSGNATGSTFSNTRQCSGSEIVKNRTTKPAVLGTLILAGALALTACSGGNNPTPSQSDSPTPTIVSPTVPAQERPPVSDQQSIESAQAAYKEYLQVYAQIAGDGGKDETPLRPLGQGVTNGGRATDFFESLKSRGNYTTGTLAFKYLSGNSTTFTTIDKNEYPFGQVDMQVCLNRENFKTVGPDGVALGTYGPQQMLYSVRAVWYNQRWTITQDWITDDKVTACDAS